MTYRFKTPPFAHQLAAWERSRNLSEFAYLMEMGTGKSKVLIDDMGDLFGRGLITAAVIVAPKSICYTWIKEQLPTHLPDQVYTHARVVLWRPSPNKQEAEALKELFRPDATSLAILVINIDAFSQKKGVDFVKKLLNAHPALIAVDESTTIKNKSAQRTKNLLKLGALARVRRILTGSPVTESPLDLWSQVEFLGSHLNSGMGYYAYRNRYAVLQKRYVSGGASFDQVVGYQRLPELQERLKSFSHRVLVEDCLDLPEKIYTKRLVELTPKQRTAYEQLRETAILQLSQTDVVTAPVVLTEILRLRQLLCNHLGTDEGNLVRVDPDHDPRLEALLDTLEETTGKALVWCNFVPVINYVRDELAGVYKSEAVGAFYGQVSAEERQELVRRFQDPTDPLRFLVMQPRTGGYGLTLVQGDLAVYYDNDWSLEIRQQSEARLHRMGQTKTVRYVDLVAIDTIDEKIISALRTKSDLSREVTGDGWKKWI